MGNTDSTPVVSQIKSLTQYIGGDSAGALATQQNFAYNNTFPVVSQIASLGYAINGENDKALDLQEKFAKDMDRVIDSIPVAGHVKGTVHFALGQNERGEESMKAASRSTGVVAGGVGGFVVGGPVGAVAGGIAGGAGMDSIITASEILIHGPVTSRPYGYYKLAEHIAEGGIKNVGDGFDAAMVPVFDGVTGLVSGSTGGMGASRGVGQIGVKKVAAPGAIETVVAGGKPKPGPSVIEIIMPPKNKLNLDKLARDNRANQLNPNHAASGPGRPAGYVGSKTRMDLNNHANQMNPNHPAFENARIGNLGNMISQAIN